MEERFKRYLEEQFRQIAPTKAAMEYRISLLNKMLDRAQDLRIKGISDEELIYGTVVGEFGDLSEQLSVYENKAVKKELGRRVAALSAVVGIAYIAALVLSYLIVGVVTAVWHPTWLIIAVGLMSGVAAVLCVSASRLLKKKAYVPFRANVAAIEIILCVVLYLILQLAVGLSGSYMVFLAMVAALFGVDTVIAFVSGSKFKWFEFPVFVEVLCVMLYVMLGISLGNKGIYIWHPTWLLCLGGFAVAIAEAFVMLAKRTGDKKKEDKAENVAVDESYWTRWE